MKCMDLFDKEYAMYEQLHDCLEYKTFSTFEYKDWLRDLLLKLLEYDSNDEIRPKELYETIYTKFKDLYQYKGIAYHGILTMNPLKDILDFYGGIVSWTSNYNIAYAFANNVDKEFHINTSVIITSEIDGMNLSEMLKDICYFYKNDNEFEFISTYIKEKEILAYMDKDRLTIRDLNKECH